MEILFEFLLGCESAYEHGNGHRAGFYFIVAVDTHDFFCDIVHHAHIVSIGGNSDNIAFHLEIELFEYLYHFFSCDIDTEKAVHSFRLEFDGGDFLLMRINVYHAVYDFACTEHIDQLTCTLQRGYRLLAVESFFKAGRAFRAHIELLCRSTNGASEESGRFENDGSRRIFDFAIRTAHDTCYGDGTHAVRYDEHIRGKLVLCIIQRNKFLFIACRADIYLLAREAGIIEGVHRLAVFEHDIVCDIDDIIDRANTACAQTHSQPQR